MDPGHISKAEVPGLVNASDLLGKEMRELGMLLNLNNSAFADMGKSTGWIAFGGAQAKSPSLNT